MARNQYGDLFKEQNEIKIEYGRNRYRKIKKNKKNIFLRVIYKNEPNNKYIKNKIKVFHGLVHTNFHNKTIPKEHVFSVIIAVDYIMKIDKETILSYI